MPHPLLPPTRRSWRQRLLRWFGGRAALERDLMYQLAPGLQGIVAPDGTLRRVGAGWLAVLGYDPASLPGRNITEFLHPADVEPTRAAVIRALAGAPSAPPSSTAIAGPTAATAGSSGTRARSAIPANCTGSASTSPN